MSTQVEDGKEAHLCGGSTNWSTISAVVHDASNSALLRCLDHLLDDECVLSEAASRSHRHQLGFVKIVLMTDVSGGCLRLHLWDRISPVSEDIHSHCADFYSRMVFGKLSENSFDLIQGNSYARFCYHFDSSVGHSVASADGFTGVSLSASRELAIGDIYCKQAMQLHNISNVTQGTLTVSAWKSRNSKAIVLKTIGASTEDCSAPLGMPVCEFRAVLLNIKDRIIGR